MFRRPLLVSSFVLAAVANLIAGPAAAATLPRLEADSLGGTHVVLPGDAGGKPLVLVLAFTPESQSDVQRWARTLLAARIAPGRALYVVVVADKTAFVSRRHIRSMVSNAAFGSKEQADNNVLVTFNGAGWHDLVPPADKKTAGVVVCDAGGSIVFAKREPYSDAAVRDVEAALKSP